jgi:hypothetical protein
LSDAVDRGIAVTEMAPMVQAIDVSPETTAAFVGRALRGPLNEPVLVRDLGQFRRRFGDVWSRSSLGPAVRQFFEHGGRRLYIVRVSNNARGALICLPASGCALVLRAVEHGSTERIRAAVDLDGIDPADDELFNLTLQRIDPANGHVIDQECYQRVSYREKSDAFVAEALLTSQLARVERPYPSHRPEVTADRYTAGDEAYVEQAQEGADGEELSDYDLIGCREKRTGLFALSRIERLDILYLPPPGKSRDLGPASLLAAELFCRSRGAMLVVDPRLDWSSPARAVAGVRDLGLASANALCYFPRARLRDDEDRAPRTVGGALSGMLCKLDRAEGPWLPLDHNGQGLQREFVPMLDIGEETIQFLARHGLNVLAKGARGKTRVAGSVTMDPSSEMHRTILPVRRFCLRILNAIEKGTRWAVFETDGRRAADTVRAQVSAYLSALQGIGAIEPGHISVDAESGPGVTILIGFRPVGWAGLLAFTLHQTAAGCRIAPTAFAPVMEGCA